MITKLFTTYLPIIISVVAITISIISYAATANYYHITSRPYLSRTQCIDAKGNVGVILLSLQAPCKIKSSSTMRLARILNNGEESDIYEGPLFASEHVIYPGKENTVIFRAPYKYPDPKESVRMYLDVEYASLSGNINYYYKELVEFKPGKPWVIINIDAN